MTFKYRVGQKVAVHNVADLPWGAKFEGLVALITDRELYDAGFGPANYYNLEGGDRYLFREDVLKPINDGDNPSTWDECAWRPNLEHPLMVPSLPLTPQELVNLALAYLSKEDHE